LQNLDFPLDFLHVVEHKWVRKVSLESERYTFNLLFHRFQNFDDTRLIVCNIHSLEHLTIFSSPDFSNHFIVLLFTYDVKKKSSVGVERSSISFQVFCLYETFNYLFLVPPYNSLTPR
jgi:hypothetical protein